MYYIYAIRNNLNGKCYVGQTINPEKRRIEHFRTNKSSKQLKADIAIYGEDNFSFEILEDSVLKEEADSREIFWINKENSFENGYNFTAGGAGGNTYAKLSESKMTEISNKIRASKIGDNNPIRKNPELVRGENNGMYGKKPHNAQPITIRRVATGELFSFETNAECAYFMSYKNSNPISSWKKCPEKIKNGYELIKY